MKYTADDLRGKYVRVGTPECDEFLKACVKLEVTWVGGVSAKFVTYNAEFIGISKLIHDPITLGHSREQYWVHNGFVPFVPNTDDTQCTVESSHGIDWSKAPKEATHALRDERGVIEFSQKIGDTFRTINNVLIGFIMGLNGWQVVEARPTEEAHMNVTQCTAESSAVKTLELLGYVWNGGEQWKPPIGNAPSYITDEIDDTVTQRGERYGLFADGAVIMQDLKTVMRATPGWERLTPSQREALEMIQHKIGRVLNGDPMYDDNWRDICGYSKLILDELNGVIRK